MYRIGSSKDIHRLENNHRPLIIGGIKFDYPKGPVAHSDGDVVMHCLGEALLGALALGDLGKYFPDNSPATFNMDSSLILKGCYELVADQGYKLVNADISIICEKPKLKDYIIPMRQKIADILETDINNISVKAGTNEGCGEVGKELAIEAFATVLIENK